MKKVKRKRNCKSLGREKVLLSLFILLIFILLVGLPQEGSLFASNNWLTGADVISVTEEISVLNSVNVDDCLWISGWGTYTIIGDLRNTTSEVCITVNSNNVIIDGDNYTIYGDGVGTGDIGIQIQSNFDNVTIKNITIANFHKGIEARDGTSNVTIFATNLTNQTWYALHLQGTFINVTNNTFEHSWSDIVQSASGSGHVEFHNNVFEGTVGSGKLLHFIDGGNHSLVSGNTFKGNSSHSSVDISNAFPVNITINGNDMSNATGVSVEVNSSYIWIVNNTGQPSTGGILLKSHAHHIFVIDNKFNESGTDNLEFQAGGNHTLIKNNDFEGRVRVSSYGDMKNITISYNSIDTTVTDAINLGRLENVTIYNNSLYADANGYGIILHKVEGALIRDNLIKQDYTGDGERSNNLILINDSNNTLFFSNTVRDSGIPWDESYSYTASLSPINISYGDSDDRVCDAKGQPGAPAGGSVVFLYEIGTNNVVDENNEALPDFVDSVNYHVFCADITGGYKNWTAYVPEGLNIFSCDELVTFGYASACYGYKRNVFKWVKAGDNLTFNSSAFNRTFNISSGYTYSPYIGGSNDTTETYGVLFNNSCGGHIANNTLMNATLRSYNHSHPCYNRLSYNNENGSINWTDSSFLQDMVLNEDIDLSVSGDIFINTDIAAVDTSLFSTKTSNINSSAQIILNNIDSYSPSIIYYDRAYNDDPDVIRNGGLNCEGSFCNQTLDSSLSEFKFNVSFLGSYTPKVCGSLTESLTMTGNYTDKDTCFEIEASNLVLDCAGRVINYSTAGTSQTYGVSNSNYDNVTIKNCVVRKGAKNGSQNYAIELTGNVENSTIFNNTIRTFGPDGDAISIVDVTGASKSNNISNNRIDTYGNRSDGIALTNSSYNIIANNQINVSNHSTPGIYLYDSSSFNNITNNIINTSGNESPGIRIVGSGINNTLFKNNITITGNDSWGINLKVTTNYTNVSNNNIVVTGTSYGLSSEGAFNSFIDLNNITTSLQPAISLQQGSNFTYIRYNDIEGGGSGQWAVKIDGGYNSTIFSNTINNTNGAGGIRIDNASSTNLTSNVIYSNGSGVDVESANGTIIRDNTILPNATSSIGIQLTSANSIIDANRINVTGTGGIGMQVTGNSSSNTISSNVINASGAAGIGVDLRESSFSNTFNLNVIHGSLSGKGIYLDYQAGANNLFLNNNITVLLAIDDNSSTSVINYLVYNSSLGEINWSLGNLSTRLSLPVGTIFLENNNIRLVDDSNVQELNGSAKIEIKNLSYTGTPQLLKNGVRCDNTDQCNISYDSDVGILYANISSFSNYTTREGCGYLDENKTLSWNVSSTGTCFTINASNVVLDCAGNQITYGSTEQGNGINNNNYDNVTIKNCIINKSGVSNSNNAAINFTNSSGNTIINNTIRTNGVNRNYGMVITSVNSSLIENNNITTDGTGTENVGVRLESSSWNNILVNNNVTTVSNGFNIKDDTGAGEVNYLIYNNSFGEINWSGNSTTNISLITNETYFIEDNLVGLIDDNGALELDGTAQIEIRNLSYSSTPQLLKDGTRCDNGDACNISSYNSTSGVLVAKVDSFSNYSTQATPAAASSSSGGSSSSDSGGSALNVTEEEEEIVKSEGEATAGLVEESGSDDLKEGEVDDADLSGKDEEKKAIFGLALFNDLKEIITDYSNIWLGFVSLILLLTVTLAVTKNVRQKIPSIIHPPNIEVINEMAKVKEAPLRKFMFWKSKQKVDYKGELDLIKDHLSEVRKYEDLPPKLKKTIVLKEPSVEKRLLQKNLDAVSRQLHGYGRKPIILPATSKKIKLDAQLELIEREINEARKTPLREIKRRFAKPLRTYEKEPIKIKKKVVPRERTENEEKLSACLSDIDKQLMDLRRSPSVSERIRGKIVKRPKPVGRDPRTIKIKRALSDKEKVQSKVKLSACLSGIDSQLHDLKRSPLVSDRVERKIVKKPKPVGRNPKTIEVKRALSSKERTQNRTKLSLRLASVQKELSDLKVESPRKPLLRFSARKSKPIVKKPVKKKPRVVKKSKDLSQELDFLEKELKKLK